MTARRHTVPMPPRVAKLDRDPRGYPITYVATRWEHLMIPPPYTRRYGLVAAPDKNGPRKLDLAHMDEERSRRCWTEGRCQVCGVRITGDRWLAGGVSRFIRDGGKSLSYFAFREPWTCGDCMAYAVEVCPGLVGGVHNGDLNVVRVRAGGFVQERLCADGEVHVFPDDPGLPYTVMRGSVLVHLLCHVTDGDMYGVPEFLRMIRGGMPMVPN